MKSDSKTPAPSSALRAPTERKHFNTENSRYSSGELCRLNGWTIGTRLIGNDGYGPTVILLSGIGEDSILARQISHNGIPAENPRECSWTLHCRDWRVAGAESDRTFGKFENCCGASAQRGPDGGGVNGIYDIEV